MKKFEIEIPEGKRAEWKEVDGHTVLELVDEEDGQAVSAQNHLQTTSVSNS